METERRALTDDEAKQVFVHAFEKSSWLGMIGQSLGAGGCLGVLVMFAGALLAWIAGYAVKGMYSGSLGKSIFIGMAIVSIAMFVHIVHQEFRVRRRSEQRRTKLLNRDDLIVQHHKIKRCLLVREPEHGSPMYFVQSDDDTIIFILEGQDELDEDWDQHPLRLNDDEKPRAKLKLIRDPETKSCLLEEFNGRALPVRECHVINLGPGQWPESGKVIKGPWDSLPKRYRLKKMPTKKAKNPEKPAQG